MFRRSGWGFGYDLDHWDSPTRLPVGVAGVVAGCCGVAGAVVGMAEVSPVSFSPPNVRTRCSLRIRQVWYTGPISWLAGSETQGADLGFEVSHPNAISEYTVNTN